MLVDALLFYFSMRIIAYQYWFVNIYHKYDTYSPPALSAKVGAIPLGWSFERPLAPVWGL